MKFSLASSSMLAVPTYKKLIEAGHEVVSLITNPDAQAGRGRKFSPNSFAQWASQENAVLVKPQDSIELNRHLLEVQPQVVITVAYGRLIPAELLNGPRFGWLNLHFSLLPRWRGAAPVQWAILSGDERTGFTIFKLDKGLDTGPTYLTDEIPLSDRAKTPDVLARLAELGAEGFVDVLPRIGRERATPQAVAGVTIAPKITKEMAKVNWKKSSIEIDRQFRALEEEPGVWSLFRGERCGLFGAELTSEKSLKPGSISVENGRMLVGTGDFALDIAEITPSGKKRMKISDFLRGARIESGETFES
jgi:methionyl-tRNA formyltransferase